MLRLSSCFLTVCLPHRTRLLLTLSPLFHESAKYDMQKDEKIIANYKFAASSDPARLYVIFNPDFFVASKSIHFLSENLLLT